MLFGISVLDITLGISMNASIKPLCAIVAVSFLLVSCGNKERGEVEVFTLYRNVPSDQAFRVHVGTFDAAGSDGKGDEFYNWSNFKNCERAQQMFQAQPDWQDVRFWCEKGRFKK